MGCVGRDKYSTILEEKAKENGLNVRYQYTDKQPTGTCAVLITNNGKYRSLCANLAAANCFLPSHIEEEDNKKLIHDAKFFYVSVSDYLNFVISFSIFVRFAIYECNFFFFFLF